MSGVSEAAAHGLDRPRYGAKRHGRTLPAWGEWGALECLLRQPRTNRCVGGWAKARSAHPDWLSHALGRGSLNGDLELFTDATPRVRCHDRWRGWEQASETMGCVCVSSAPGCVGEWGARTDPVRPRIGPVSWSVDTAGCTSARSRGYGFGLPRSSREMIRPANTCSRHTS